MSNFCFAQTNYYVDITGNNANSGSLSSPWKTIQYGLNQLPANGILNVFPGTYSEKITIPNNNITLKNYSAVLPVIDAGGITSQNAILAVNNKSNVTIEGIELQNNIQNDAQGILIEGSGTNITVKNCKIHDIHFSANPNAAVNETVNAQGIIVFGTNATTAITNLKIQNNELYNCRLGYSEGIAVNGNVNGFEVTGNNVHNLTNIGIDIIGHEGTCPNPANDQARNGLVKNNTAHHCTAAYSTSGGIYIDGGKNITVENNTSYHNGYGIEVGCEKIGQTTDGIIIRNNVFYDNEICALAMGGFAYPSGSGKVINSSFRNNTCLMNDYSGSGNGELYLSYSENSTIENNIFYTSTQNILAYAELTQPGLKFNYNNFFCQAGTASLTTDWNGNEYAGYAAIVTGTATNTNSIFANPQLTTASGTNPDFHLLTSSPAKNAGNPAYVPANTETDYYNQLRIEGGIIDCGADEFGSANLGIDEMEISKFSIYPNPATNFITIDSEIPVEKYQIFNGSGQKLMEGSERNKINISELGAGMYFIKFQIENKNYVSKIIKR
ncbi:right-handed parallel beta-helix repeat-containing protein [Flavobacterium circumlabens]|uniref:Secreted protein (Por secretion system target) n=1 Tax=Flavobacterium circumlabens TaxID=2133765 RepID=A0ABY2B4P4_9FLAO|nr:right-handed parallel beta-helix repeat-containing protein [Flavobacterium circumlabens]TCN60011.1 putative secreted protein (Por secretion system target) [Flavobacterium circumlabens]